MIKGLMIAVNKHGKSDKVQRDSWVGQRGRRRKAKPVLPAWKKRGPALLALALFA